MSDEYCMLYCKEYKAWLGLEGSKSQINDWGFDFSHIDDVSFALVSNKDDAYVFEEYGDDVEKIMDDLYYDEGIQLRRMWVVSPEDKTVTKEEDLEEDADEYEDEEEDDAYDDEDDMDESFRIRSVRKNTIEEAFKLLRNPKKKINEDTKKFEDKDAEEEYFRHIQELSTDYEDPDAEEYDEDDYEEDDIKEESLKEDYLPKDIYSLCNVIPLDELDEDEVDYEAIEDLENQMGCRVLGVLASDVDELNYYYWCDDGYAYMGVPLTPDSNTYRWYSKDVNEIAELINGSEDDLDESLNEDAKFITAATILKKEQNKIFAQTTEEGMRKMVLDILDKNKDKMKPENYGKVVKTMKNCPKSAVPSTVWTMLNPSQKVGK